MGMSNELQDAVTLTHDLKRKPLIYEKSRAEMLRDARQWMLDSYGNPKNFQDRENKDRWYQRFGMLVDFITEKFPQ
jgi:hypothetical protein